MSRVDEIVSSILDMTVITLFVWAMSTFLHTSGNLVFIVRVLLVPPDRDTGTCSKYCSLRRRQQEQKHQRNDDLNNSCFPIIS